MQILQEVLRWGGAVIVIALVAIASLLSVSSHLPRPRIPWPHVRWRRPQARKPSALRRLLPSSLPRERLRRWTPALIVAVAIAAGVLSVAHITVSPPGVTFAPSGSATARASVVVDTPDSILADLRQSTENLQTLDDRSAVLGSVVGSPPVRDYVARTLKIPRSQVEIIPAGMEPEVGATSYQMSIQVNAEVPILDLQAHAPTPHGAVAFANAAIAGLRKYMTALAAKDKVRVPDQLRVTQIGSAVLDYGKPGPDWMHGLLVFALVLGAAYFGLARLERARAVYGTSVGAAA
jgi:hypothetical protein